jgi:repressor LexA
MMQEKCCDNRFCDLRTEPLDEPVDQMAIIAALKERKIKQVEVARMLGISTDKVSKSYKGADVRRFSSDETQTLLRFLGMAPAASEAPAKLPIIGLVPAGNWREAVEHPIGWIHPPDPNLPLDSFVVRIEGDSMDEVAGDGANIVVDPHDKQLITRKLYIIRNADGDVTFKRFMADPARFVPVSSNKAHLPIMVGEDWFEIVGRVVMKAEWL